METEKRRVRNGERLNPHVCIEEFEPDMEGGRVSLESHRQRQRYQEKSLKEDRVVERSMGVGKRGSALICFLLSQPQAVICVTADCTRYHSCPCRGTLPKKVRPGKSINCIASNGRVGPNVWLQTPGARGQG